MSENLTEIGVGFCAFVLFVKIFMDFWDKQQKTKKESDLAKAVRELRDQNAKVISLLREILDLCKDLHKWHDVSDSEGVKIWYVRKSLEEAIGLLAKNLEKQTEVLQLMMNEVKDMHREVLQAKEKGGN